MGCFPRLRDSRLSFPRHRADKAGKAGRLAWHLAVCVFSVAAVLAICLRVRHVDHATVALLLVLTIVQLAKMWGTAEALAGTIAGAAGFEYYFLPPRGFAIASTEHWIALIAFILTAAVTGEIAARLNRRRIGAMEKQLEMERLYRLVNSLLETESAEATVAALADNLVQIFGFDGVAVYDAHTARIVRRGPHGDVISDRALREGATSGSGAESVGSTFSLAAIRHGGELAGSIGVCGPAGSDGLLDAIAGRVGLGLARLYAVERTTEAEVARRSEELKSAVMDAMAHEIRNPLNSIRIAATSLLSGPGGGETWEQDMLAIIDEESIRMDRYLDEAARVSRLEAGQLALKKKSENIGRLIPEAIAEVGALAGDRAIEVCIPEKLPPAECDKDLIARVLRQLLSNAVKYSPQGSPLTISAAYTDAGIVIDVVDRGPGVGEEERERIFEKHYRGRAARPGTRGTGLGLASAKAIVKAHGGSIWVTRPAAGGAAFHVSLPAARPAAHSNGAGARR